MIYCFDAVTLACASLMSKRYGHTEGQLNGGWLDGQVDRQKLIIILVGLPGRGKTFLCNKLMCYLNW